MSMMTKKDVCPCCGHTLPPLRVRIAYGGMPECPHCGSHCGLPPKPLVDLDPVMHTKTRRFLIASIIIWTLGVAAVLWGAWSWGGP